MTRSRRHFIELGASVSLSTGALAACATKPVSTGHTAAVRAVNDKGSMVATFPLGFDVFFEQRGYTAAPAASLITRHPLNGGLCYDEDTGPHRQDLREAAGCAF